MPPCHPCPSPWLAQQALPIQTSPNCPFPSFLRSWRDSRGISHTSLVLTERSASLGVPLWHGTARRQHSPAARSAAGAGDRGQGSMWAWNSPALCPLPPPQTSPGHRQHPNAAPSPCPGPSSAPPGPGGTPGPPISTQGCRAMPTHPRQRELSAPWTWKRGDPQGAR